MRYSEASRDVARWLSWHLPVIPELMFYDNASQFGEYALSRAPGEYGEGQIMYVRQVDRGPPGYCGLNVAPAG